MKSAKGKVPLLEGYFLYQVTDWVQYKSPLYIALIRQNNLSDTNEKGLNRWVRLDGHISASVLRFLGKNYFLFRLNLFFLESDSVMLPSAKPVGVIAASSRAFDLRL